MPKGIPNKKYTGEFKQKVVETIRREKISFDEACKQFDIPSRSPVRVWERIYLEEGPEGLYVERRGHACAASGSVKKGRPPKLDKKAEEDLISENQRLRAEVAYLKKLNALVAERERKEKKHK